GPAFDRDRAIARINSNSYAARIEPRRPPDKIWIADRLRSHNDPRDALAAPAFDAVDVPDAAAELERNFDGHENCLDRGRVHRAPGEGAVEIDDMEVFEPLARERQSLGGGVLVEYRGLCHVALLEAHAMALLEIDRREQNHGRHLR